MFQVMPDETTFSGFPLFGFASERLRVQPLARA